MVMPRIDGRGGDTRNRGLALVASVGVLGVLSVMALAFASVMRLEAKAARNYAYAVRAEFVARAGVEDAIARLRSIARDGAELPYENGRPASWYTWRGTAGGGWKTSFASNEAVNGLDDDGDGLVDGADADETASTELGYTDWVSSSYADGGDTFTLRVRDAAGRINVNAGDNLGTILDNLCRVAGPPLAAAEAEALMPRWFYKAYPRYAGGAQKDDEAMTQDLFYRLDQDDRPLANQTGVAVYGDGYAIAGYRSRHGAFLSTEDVRAALTWIERGDGDGDGDVEPDTPEERMEIEAKFAALRPYITVDSWCDTDQIGYGKFEHVVTKADGKAARLVDRNRTWNVSRNDGDGELKGCYLAIVNGIGQGQLKTIAKNTIDTIILDDSLYAGSELRVPPNHDSSYAIIGRDHNYDASPDEWYNQSRLYAKQPLSIHRSPVNVNTATDKVLVSLVMGLQTNWGPAGYLDNDRDRSVTGDWYALCPSVLSVGRDGHNALPSFDLPCPNDSTLSGRMRDPGLAVHGHPHAEAPFCFFCNYGRPYEHGGVSGRVGEAHYIAWQILKEREQSREHDERSDTARAKFSNGHGPFKGWDDLYFRVFRPWERGCDREMSVRAVALDGDVPRASSGGTSFAAALTAGSGGGSGHPGVARLCMANFNANADLLKFQPNIEWINRWGVNFTDLYLPRPNIAMTNWNAYVASTGDMKLRVRPGELLDKTDLNVGTTEFTFDSGGVYEVESVGRVHDGNGVVAEKTVAALVRIYGVWRESTQREFVAGTLSTSQGAVGSGTSGQITADGVSRGRPGGDTSLDRKALCTYPEPVVPGALTNADGKPAPLAVGASGRTVKPAGFDGQIMLATNTLTDADGTAPEGPPDEVLFSNSFTGRLAADFARGDANPRRQGALGMAQGIFSPLDEVGLLGEADSTAFDMAPQRDPRTGECVEGEGKGGDLRPDGVYLGVTNQGTPLDGSIEFDGRGNMNKNRGTVSMWVKPNWHHGTYTAASLPVDYVRVSRGMNANYEKGSNVSMKRWGGHWPAPYQKYRSEGDRHAIGYVRERFEHEFFNACISTMDPNAGRGGGGYWGSKAFVLRKCGDEQNTCGDADLPEGGPIGTSPFASLHVYQEDQGDGEVTAWIPGWTVGDPTSRTETGRPYYRLCPFRWFFLGLSWNYSPPGLSPIWHNDDGNIAPYGQLREESTFGGGTRAENPVAVASGAAYDTPGCANATPELNLAMVLLARPFVDTMRHWDRPASSFTGDDDAERVEDWAMDLFGSCNDDWRKIGLAPEFDKFGINRLVPEDGGHFYNRVTSGTYATIDEFTVSDTWRDPRRTGASGFEWARERRRTLGRYYFARDARDRPHFTSQTLFDSERAQSYAFRDDERDEAVELGCVRWYVFTPYYCLHMPGRSDYEFPYDSYFLETASADATTNRVSQSNRFRPCEWPLGPQDRRSSQRGVTVSIVGDKASLLPDESYEHTSPESWDPVLAAGTRSGQHARSAAGELRYRVRMGWSAKEYRDMNADAVVVDSPVFDDITVTYMRRPKILQWREVSE